MEISVESYVYIFLLIGFSGFVDSIAGGGGLISIPTYVAFGLPAEFILGTNKATSTIGTTAAVVRYIRAKLVHWPIALFAIVAALVGSYFGAKLSSVLSKEWMFYLILIVAPIVIFLNHRYVKTGRESHRVKLSWRLALMSTVIGLVIGFYDGFFGPGTGSFLIVAFVWGLKFSLKEASANARIVNYSSNFSAFVTFVLSGAVLWSVVIVAAVGSVFGNLIGSQLVVKKADLVVKPIFNCVLVLLILKCAHEIFLRS